MAININLLSDDIQHIGTMRPEPALLVVDTLLTENVVIAPRQILHILQGHPEMANHFDKLSPIVSDPILLLSIDMNQTL